MKSSIGRYLALGVLLAGIALIVWTAVSDPDDDRGVTETAGTPTAAPATTAQSGQATAPADQRGRRCAGGARKHGGPHDSGAP